MEKYILQGRNGFFLCYLKNVKKKLFTSAFFFTTKINGTFWPKTERKKTAKMLFVVHPCCLKVFFSFTFKNFLSSVFCVFSSSFSFLVFHFSLKKKGLRKLGKTTFATEEQTWRVLFGKNKISWAFVKETKLGVGANWNKRLFLFVWFAQKKKRKNFFQNWRYISTTRSWIVDWCHVFFFSFFEFWKIFDNTYFFFDWVKNLQILL